MDNTIISKYLDWDSNFFQKRIFRIEAEDASDAEIMEQIDRISDEADIIYLFCNHEVSINKYRSALVDLKRSYLMPTPQFTPVKTEIVEFKGKPELLYNLAIQSGEHSRYNVDPYFENEDFIKLYKVWIDNSVDGGFADYVLVPEGDTIKGMITGKVKDNQLSIGLLATDSQYRGEGIGSSLIGEIINIASKRGLMVEVTTQSDNENACRFYENRGFEIGKEEFVYHIYPKFSKKM